MKPIPTTYAGIQFRSRLEARWAVFFDRIGLRWDYEPEGYQLEGDVRYLPDFLLRDFGGRAVLVEIKPEGDPASSFWKADLLRAAGFVVLQFRGAPIDWDDLGEDGRELWRGAGIPVATYQAGVREAWELPAWGRPRPARQPLPASIPACPIPDIVPERPGEP